MSDKRERLHELEEAIKAIAPFLPGRRRPPPAPEVIERQRERRREAQRRRRRLPAGLIETKLLAGGKFRMDFPVKRKCEHCGTEFKPKRTTARFCCAKCRVYASRAKAAAARDAGPTNG
jgi:hypothetical protein